MDRIVRDGATVRRPLEVWSASVHHLLAHLDAAGFPAPRFLRVEDDHEVLTWIDGESGAAGWSKVVPEEGLVRWGRFLRRYHDAVGSYRPPADCRWSCGPRACGEDEIVCHGDFGPWNAVWCGDELVGLTDWDHARPASPLFEVAYALEYVAPFRSDEDSIRDMGYLAPPDRSRRIELFCAAYGIDVPEDVVEQVAAQQRLILRTVEGLASQGVEPQVTWVREGHLAELEERIRFTEGLRL